MKKIIFALLLSFSIPAVASAVEGIAVVDIEDVRKQSVAIEKIQSEVQKKRKQFQDKVQAKQDEMREGQKKLAEQRSLLAKDVYEGKIKEFQTKANEISRELQQQRLDYDKALTLANNEVTVVIAEIVAELAKEKGFNLAVPSTVVLYYTQPLDITKEVVSRLNKKLPKVKTKLP